MQRPFEQLAPSNYRDRRARLARLREVVGEILGPHWEVHVKPGRRRIHLVCGESKPPTPDLELLAAAILWESRKNGDSFRKLVAVQPGTQPMEVPMGNPDAGAKGIVRPPCHGGPFSDGRGQ